MRTIEEDFESLLRNNSNRDWEDEEFRNTMADAFRFNVNNRIEWLKETWKHQCKCMFGADWNESKDFKIFYEDFLKDINTAFPKTARKE